MRFLLLMVVIDSIGLGLIIPLLPNLVSDFTGSTASAAAWLGGLLALDAALQFLFAPLLGALSDRFGRKPLIVASLLGSLIDFLILAFAPALWWLILGRLVGGVTNAYLPTLNAYVADTSDEASRAKNFGRVGAAFGVGFILGPALGGLLADFGERTPFLVVAGLTALNAVYAALVLPESLPAERRRAFSPRSAHPFAAIANLRRVPSVRAVAAILLLVALAEQTLYSTFVLYAKERFGWGPAQTGVVLTVFGVAGLIVEGGLVAFVVRRFGERRAAFAGLAFSALGFVGFGLAFTPWLLYAAIPLASLGALYAAPLQSRVAALVSPNELGGVQGALASLTSLTGVAGPLLGTTLLSAASQPGLPSVLLGSPFFVGAALAVVALLVAVRALRRV